MQPRSLIFKVASPLFYQPGQGKARLRPSSTSYRLARQLTPTNAQARKGVRFCLRTTLQEVCWILGGETSALFFKSQLSERQKAASSGFWKMVLAESRRPRTSPRRSRRPDSIPFPGVPSAQKKTPRQKNAVPSHIHVIAKKVIKQKPDQPSQPQQSPASS